MVWHSTVAVRSRQRTQELRAWVVETAPCALAYAYRLLSGLDGPRRAHGLCRDVVILIVLALALWPLGIKLDSGWGRSSPRGSCS